MNGTLELPVSPDGCHVFLHDLRQCGVHQRRRPYPSVTDPVLDRLEELEGTELPDQGMGKTSL